MSEKILCGTHGRREPRYICAHLFENGRNGPAMEYYEPRREANEPIKFIWCEACEDVVVREGGFTEAALDYVNARTLCDFCFQPYIESNVAADAYQSNQADNAALGSNALE